MTFFRIASTGPRELLLGPRDLNAVISVTGVGRVNTPSLNPERNGWEHGGGEVVVVDTSRLMQGPKLTAVKTATAAAIDCIPDGVRFAIVSGDHEARVVFPGSLALAPASDRTRARAKKAVARLKPGGSSVIGSWIELTTTLLRNEPGINHAVVLTDPTGTDRGDASLDIVLQQVRGRFVLDYRVLGTGMPATAFLKADLGSVNFVDDPYGFAKDFISMLETARSTAFADVTLRVWTPQRAEVRVLNQVRPTIVDLTGSRIDPAPLVGNYPIGPWGDEDREYRMTVRVNDLDLAARSGRAYIEEMWRRLSQDDGSAMPPSTRRRDHEVIRAAEVDLLVGGEEVGHATVFANWMDSHDERPPGGVREPRRSPPSGPSAAAHLEAP